MAELATRREGHAAPVDVLDSALAGHDVALVDILDRALATGVVVTGDIHISIADVELVRLDLRLLLASVESLLSGKDTK